jgi:hypothetical protein
LLETIEVELLACWSRFFFGHFMLIAYKYK